LYDVAGEKVVIGSTAKTKIAASQWRKLATEVRRNPEELLAALRSTAEAMPDHVLNIQQLVKQDGPVHPIVNRLSDKLVTRARECGRLLR
jgi:hypothetical protein